MPPDQEVGPLVVAYHLIYDATYAEYGQPATPPPEPSTSLLATSPPMNMKAEVPFFSEGEAQLVTSENTDMTVDELVVRKYVRHRSS